MPAMDIICITGPAQNELDTIAAMLAQAGMAAPMPASVAAARNKELDLTRWHEQVVAGKDAELTAQIAPGRLWEQLAGDLFVANMQAGLWGWADTRSTWLLDFWLNFEPNLKFILVCVSPQQMLADTLAGAEAGDEQAVSNTMTRWLTRHQEMLRFHNRHPQRTVLVAAEDCLANPDALLTHCQEKWQLPLNKPDVPFTAPPAADTLFRFLAELRCRDFPELESLNNELAATMTRFGEDSVLAPTLEQAVADYRKVLTSYERAESSARVLEQTRLSQLKTLEQERDAQKKLAQEYQARIEQISKERDSHSKLAQERQTQIEQLTKKHDVQVQQIQDLTGKLDKANKELEKSNKEQDTLVKAKTSAEQARQHAEQALKVSEDKLRDSNEENELLLLQLHQVQEELEHYFLRHQEAQTRLQQAEDRWQNMMRRHPDYVDYESLEIIAAGNDQDTSVRWRVKGLQAAGRSFAELEFRTSLEQGIAGLLFERTPEPAGPLLRWPTVVGGQHEIGVIPVAQNGNRQQRAAILLDLAASDWNLLRVLAKMMEKELSTAGSQAQQYLAQHQAQRLTPIRAGINQFKEILEAFPAIYRFDGLSLKHEQVNPGYEHLWLRCDNVAFGANSWPAFEFRLACANVTPDRFGSDPKLEIPQEAGAPALTGWFAESEDNFGAKLELRFALPEAMDVEVWNQLPPVDQQFINALLQRLPAMLETLRSRGITLQRPWQDWVFMAQEMARIFAERTAMAPFYASGTPEEEGAQ